MSRPRPAPPRSSAQEAVQQGRGEQIFLNFPDFALLLNPGRSRRCCFVIESFPTFLTSFLSLAAWIRNVGFVSLCDTFHPHWTAAASFCVHTPHQAGMWQRYLLNPAGINGNTGGPAYLVREPGPDQDVQGGGGAGPGPALPPGPAGRGQARR